MRIAVAFFLLLEVGLLASSRLDNLTTIDDYMNICLDGRNHKSSPGPEQGLVKQFCSPWAARSCCTSETAEGMHINRNWLNFDWDHCRELTPRCREHFLMDLCFYECSPNVGPWLVKDVRKIRKERFKYVPLCKSVCDNWWNACKDDFACVENWAEEFDWSKGINTCPVGSKCQTFEKIYGTAHHFCEVVMGHSFEVVPDTEDCFYTWFDPQLDNPNEEVARKKAASILGVPYYTVKKEGQKENTNKDNGSCRHELWFSALNLCLLSLVLKFFH